MKNNSSVSWICLKHTNIQKSNPSSKVSVFYFCLIISECPCLHGGKCLEENFVFSCQCADGFCGDICEAELNECESDPCIHGYCTDMINAYSCLCEEGYEGNECHGKWSFGHSSLFILLINYM